MLNWAHLQMTRRFATCKCATCRPTSSDLECRTAWALQSKECSSSTILTLPEYAQHNDLQHARTNLPPQHMQLHGLCESSLSALLNLTPLTVKISFSDLTSAYWYNNNIVYARCWNIPAAVHLIYDLFSSLNFGTEQWFFGEVWDRVSDGQKMMEMSPPFIN